MLTDVEPVAETASPAPAPAWWARLRTGFRYAGPALVLFVALRLIATLGLWVIVHLAPDRIRTAFRLADGTQPGYAPWHSMLDLLTAWDGRWYLAIAQGYGPAGALDGHGVPFDQRLAFSPLYPFLIRVLSSTGLGGVWAGLLIAAAASVAAAWGIFAIGDRLRGRWFGAVLAGLWAVAPASGVETAVFAESLFTALAAWALYAVLTRHWLLAGGLTLVAGLTRPSAPALIGVVGLAALIALVKRQDGWQPYAAVVLAPLGYLGWAAYVGYRMQRVDGFFWLQGHYWKMRVDFGRRNAVNLARVVFGEQPRFALQVYLFAALVIVGALMLLVLLLLQRMPWVLPAYAAAVLVSAVGYASDLPPVPRHLLPAFPLLMPLALVLSDKPTRARRVGALVVLVGLATLAGWYGYWLPISSEIQI